MTKNNLAAHLRWLLNQGPSLYPSLTPSQPANQTVDIASHSASDRTNLPADRPGAGTVGQQENIETGLGHFGRDGAELKDDSDADMARLALAPNSASKPRMLSLAKNSSSKTPSRQGLDASPSRGRGTGQDVVKESQRDLPSFSHNKSPVKSDRKPPRDDVDTIDLTGDFEHTTSSSTVEEFGEPRRLWAEDATFRKEAEQTRGRKRKSDEYMSDIFSPERHAPKSRSPGKFESPQRSKYEQPNASPTVPALKSHRSASPIKLSRRESPVPARKRVDRVIADSEDEDEEDEDLFDWMHEDDPILDTGERLYPELPRVSPEEKDNVQNSKQEAHGPKTPITSKDNGIPVSQSFSTDQPPAGKSTNAQQVEPHQLSPFPALSFSQDKRDPSVAKYLAISADSIVQLVTSLTDNLTKNSEFVYQRAMEGQSVSEIITENRSIVDRIDAIKALEEQRIAYDACTPEKDRLKQVLVGVISRGGDPHSMPEELAKSRTIIAEQEQIEAKMRELLPRADVLGLSSSSPDVNISRCDLSERTGSSAAKEPSIPNTPKIDNVANDSGANKNSVLTSPLRETSPKESSRPDISSPAKRSFPVPVEENARNPFEYDEPMISEGEDCFTRTMGSPGFPASDIDEFELGADDEEMLEAAEHFEDAFALPGNSPEPPSRPVFAETSGNALRTSPPKKPTHNPLWNNHPWSMDVKAMLKERFQLRGFRLNQLEAIDATLSGKDTFVLMPTGGGKSLCYQLPSVVTSGSTKGVTVVISPLLSLMQDQVTHLRRLKIKAFLLNGETEVNERKRIMSTLFRVGADEHIELLYITPEMITKSTALINSLERLNQNRSLARIVIDEAHCVSQWGHDFRPDYKALGEVRTRLVGVPMMALTATATENVKMDVIHNLRMEGCQVFSQSFNRPNLTYEVRPKRQGLELLESIAETIKGSYPNESGIIYCLARKSCEKVAADLRQQYGLKAAHYHAGMKAEQKAEVQRDWQSGKHHVIVATIAFGMGIDKPDVRFVIHHSIPKSLEGYYQETGRAGRDGKRSGCYLYYGYKDVASLKRMIERGEGSNEQKARQLRMLRNVIQYCDNRSDCRRVQILRYFNEYFRREECDASCDNCRSSATFEIRDYSQHAAVAVGIVRYFEEALNKDVTLLHCVDVFLGNPKKAKSQDDKGAPGYGSGEELGLGEAERLFYRLLGEEALLEKNVFAGRAKFPKQYIKVGRLGSAYENRRRPMKLDVRVSPKGKSEAARSTRGARARGDEYPQSTNVSSPVQSANRRRLARFRYNDDAQEDSDGDKDSDGFEQIRVAGKPRREKTRRMGPPITNDPKWENLEPLHRAVAEDFIYYAEEYCKNVMLERSLRAQPFPTSVLREISIHFPTSKAELAGIRGIDPDKVERYGRQILKLVRDAQRRYEELRKDKYDASGVVPDPNRHNVINLSSSDEYSDGDIFMDATADLDQDGDVVSSRYFTSQPPTYESPDEYQPGPSPMGRSTSRKRQPSKRPRRKSTGESRPKGKGSKGKAKSGEGAGNNSSSRKGSKPKQPTARIQMMPIK